LIQSYRSGGAPTNSFPLLNCNPKLINTTGTTAVENAFEIELQNEKKHLFICKNSLELLYWIHSIKAGRESK
jgi:hypothetical protein